MAETVTSAASARTDTGDCWTIREIRQQPQTLRDTAALLCDRQAEIEQFLAPLLDDPGLRIVLAGAGTSAFIGECLAPWLARILGRRVEAIPTTDIVSAPEIYLERDTSTLLVSFGRSGSSPESVAAASMADALIANVHHLIITCNAEGALAREAGENAHVVVLPEATHDNGFAMTSSFSAMMLAALGVFSGIGALAQRIDAIAGGVATMLQDSDAKMRELARTGYSRVVYLGSGVFKGLAREAALKLLELTDGRIVTAFDTPMGFRHGPKTVVNPETLVVVFVSNDPHTALYDRDLIAELRSDGVAGAVVTVAAGSDQSDTLRAKASEQADDSELLFPFIVPAQLFALYASLDLGMTPDTPNASGVVNRVVQGVRIHPLDEA